MHGKRKEGLGSSLGAKHRLSRLKPVRGKKDERFDKTRDRRD